MRMLNYFDAYVKLGLQPIAIHPVTKVPVAVEWNINWSVERWRCFFENPKKTYNMGILLGDVVDVEGDTEEANDLLERMIDGAKRPKFRSNKSIHNLFVNPDPDLTWLKLKEPKIEFRGYSVQSIVPPSKHSSGQEYRWLQDSKFPIPPMPEELKEFYFRNKKAYDKKISKSKKNHARRTKKYFRKTTCNCCGGKFFIHQRRLALEVAAFSKYFLRWMCHGCRELDVRESCREIRRLLDEEKNHRPQHS